VASDWNRLLERLLAEEGLTVAELRLALALARLLLGWKRSSAPLGRALLRQTAGLDGRTFERTLASLVRRGLVQVEPGRIGKGNRAVYTLNLLPEKAALQRPIEQVEKAVPQRPKEPVAKGRSNDTQKAALQRPRKGRGKGRTSPPATPTGEKTLQTLAIDAYVSHGGSLELDHYCGALVRQVKTLHDRGVPEHVILAAAAQLGRERGFPGYLAQTADELQAHGGPCQWDGLDRSRLTATQLADCDCHACNAWHEQLTAGSTR